MQWWFLFGETGRPPDHESCPGYCPGGQGLVELRQGSMSVVVRDQVLGGYWLTDSWWEGGVSSHLSSSPPAWSRGGVLGTGGGDVLPRVGEGDVPPHLVLVRVKQLSRSFGYPRFLYLLI